MKEHGEARNILGMRIDRDMIAGKLYLSEAKYIKKVLSRFWMQDANSMSTQLGSHFKLSNRDSPSS